MSEPILQKLGMVSFKPLPFLNNGLKQTLAALYFPYNPFIDNSQQHTITLPDGDKIVLVENRPLHWRPSQRIALLVHGLTGSHLSKYLVRITHQLTNQGFLVIRMNLRGCGLGKGLAKHLYHSGRSEDTRAVIKWLSEKFLASPVTQIGFSLGANITLKMAGEDGDKPSGNLDSVVAVSPPLDLEASVRLILKKRNKMFNDHFVKELIEDAIKLHQTFPDTPAPTLPKSINLYQFDDLYTAPRSGFVNAKEYYTRSSCAQFIKHITLPTFILYSIDDPLISRIKYFSLPNQKNLDLLITKQGGHVGWVGKTSERCQLRWMDKAIVQWVKWLDNSL